MKLLLLKYNKVTNESFEKILQKDGNSIQVGDLSKISSSFDDISMALLRKYLEQFEFDAVLVGDIFWPTGQRICQWCRINNKKCYFLQHGQWIYTANKKSPEFLPECTFVFGDYIRDEIKSWPYGKRSRVETVGSPRYEDLNISEGDYVYFSPPVILELSPSARPIKKDIENQLKVLEGLDRNLNLLIHPHYREGSISLLKKWFPKANFLDSQSSALESISKSRCVLTHRNSTVVLDGIACRKHVTILPNCKSYYPKGYFETFASEATNVKDLIYHLERNHSGIENYEDKSRKYIMLGQSSKRIIDIIRKDCV